MSAGSSVSAEIIVTTTTIAAARPSDPTKPTPEMYRPSTETATVLPATTIAAPDVPAARRIERDDPHPVVQLLPVPGHQEKPVVDRDPEPEQGGDGRPGGRERDQPRDQPEQREPGEHAEDRRHQRDRRPRSASRT